MTRNWAAIAALSLCLLALALVSPARAQTQAPSVPEVDALLAPIALYPDPLLMPLLMAASYPEEVEEAQEWLAHPENARLRGAALVAALTPRPWDPSVKTLVPFPETLGMLAGRPEWMRSLGHAFAASSATVLAEIQKLRRAAMSTGFLKSSPHMTVTTTADNAVNIRSADPAVVYVPVYNPALVFGAWPYPEHPPGFIEPPAGFRVAGADMSRGIGFSIGFGVEASLWGWSHPDWAHDTVAIDTAAYERIDRYGPHVAAAVWHHETHGTGYFHITQAEITPTPAKHAHARVAAKIKAGRVVRLARRGGWNHTRILVRLTRRGRAVHARPRLLRAAGLSRGADRRAVTAAVSHRRGKMRMAQDRDRRG
jgi:hypothetical protein